MQTIEEFKQAIKAATTKKELDDIGYKAFVQDSEPMVIPPSFSVRPKTFSERVDRLVHKRLHELGLVDDEAYIPTDDNGNYTDKQRLAAEKEQFYGSMKELFAQFPDM